MAFIEKQLKVTKQINSHIHRLHGGIELCENNWPPENLFITNRNTNSQSESDLVRIMVILSSWCPLGVDTIEILWPEDIKCN
ncbi:MAG: hypothetical protein NTX61_12745 [Bacteroidetes bacterium]|nr:hypothetical protein [Bacteroidota bacterium]